VLGITVIEFPSQYASDADDYLRKGLATFDAWRDHPLIRFALAPHAPYTVADKTFERIGSLADELELPIHIHIHETARRSRTACALRPAADRPARSPRPPRPQPDRRPRRAPRRRRHRTPRPPRLRHRPLPDLQHEARQRRRTGRPLLDKGLNVGLGTDGAASNNRLDLFREMQQASLLAKLGTGDAAALPAHRALRMATLDGARALGLDHEIGSIPPARPPTCAPCTSPTPTPCPASTPSPTSSTCSAGTTFRTSGWLDSSGKVADCCK
jgi:5-methylthioadenosine/S-adenosylhomocysteine deaminase